MWGTHVGPTEAKTLVSAGPRRRSYAAEPARFNSVVFAEAFSRSGWKPYAVCIHKVNECFCLFH